MMNAVASAVFFHYFESISTIQLLVACACVCVTCEALRPGMSWRLTHFYRTETMWVL
jgi:hypothetical protein